METFARAILAGRKMKTVDTSKWEAFLRKACDVHAARILDDAWRPRSTNEGFLISPLCKAFGLFDTPSYRRAAMKAAQHYADRHPHVTEPYRGGTLDTGYHDHGAASASC